MAKAKAKDGKDVRPRGRPSLYTPEIAQEICERLAKGETLRRICRDDHLPEENTVRGWATRDVEGFFAQYARSRDIGLDCMADEILDIADDGSNDWMERRKDDENSGWVLNGEHVQRSRVRIDTRKWYLSKMAPKRYGNAPPPDGGNGPDIDDPTPGIME